MADATPDLPQPKPKRGKPWGYLVFAVIILGVFGVFIAAPDLPRNLLGGAPAKPDGLGDAPAKAGNVNGGELDERALANEMADLGTIRTQTPPTVVAVKPTEPTKPTKPVVAADEAKATQFLTEAEAAYQAMDWDKAESAARRAGAAASVPRTKARAADIETGAPLLKSLFKDLGDRDELSRNFETHPSLIRLVKSNGETLAVPITQMEPPYNPVADNPVAWIQAQAKAGKVMLLIKGAKQFTPALMDVEGYEILAADQAATRAGAQQALSGRVIRVQSDKAAARDAFAWYELGKFAYRNRIDDQVVKHLDMAIGLDPSLAKSVREANAGILFGSMVAHMKNGNKQQAAAFMTSIERRYKDTDSAKQARLFYEGKQAELIAAAREAERKQKEEVEARRAALLAAAKKKGDNEGAKRLEEAARAEEEENAAAAADVPVDGAIASARNLRDQGAKLLGEAMGMPATDARNHKYAEAATILTKAKAAFASYCEKHAGDSSAEAEMVETSQMLFSAKKNKTL